MLSSVFWNRFLSTSFSTSFSTAFRACPLSVSLRGVCVSLATPHIITLVHVWITCACALSLQPLLLIRDLGLKSFQTSLVTLFSDVIQQASSPPIQYSQTVAKVPVRNSASVYLFASTASESALELSQKARTNSIKSYLQALRRNHGDVEAPQGFGAHSAEAPQGFGAHSILSTFAGLTVAERKYAVSVQYVLSEIILCVLYEPVMQDLSMGPNTFYPAQPGVLSDPGEDQSCTLLHSIYW